MYIYIYINIKIQSMHMILYKELFFDVSSDISDLGRSTGHLETCPLTAAPLPLS